MPCGLSRDREKNDNVTSTSSSWHAGKEEQELVSILSNLENFTVPGAVQSYKRPIVRVKNLHFSLDPIWARRIFSSNTYPMKA